MPSQKRKGEGARTPCARLYADDGVDRREDKRRAVRELKKPDRKLQQLCKQASQALQLALPTLAKSDLLFEVTLGSVLPAPNAGRFRVEVLVADAAQQQRVKQVLERCSGYLRAEIASVVSRRRAPELVFSVIVRGECNV